MTREEITKAAEEYADKKHIIGGLRLEQFIDGVNWTLTHLWKDAQGEDLPPIDKEVVVIDKRGKVSFGHRPDPKGFNCKNIDTGKIEHLEPMTYGKGGWNFPDIRYWLDIDLPNTEE